MVFCGVIRATIYKQLHSLTLSHLSLCNISVASSQGLD